MKAITLWPEWAFAICDLGKLVENRTWHPGRALAVGDQIAIHAGKHPGGRPGRVAMDEAYSNVLSMWGATDPNSMVYLDLMIGDHLARSAIVAVATVAGFDRDQRTGWDVPDSWHWRLSDVVAFADPIACPGAQGLWTPADGIQAAIAARLEAP